MEGQEASKKTVVRQPRRRWLQFSMRSLIVLSLVGGVSLGWLGIWLSRLQEEPDDQKSVNYVIVYDVADLVNPTPGSDISKNFDALIGQLETTIAPDSWDSVGGTGAVAGFEQNLALVISQTPENHAQVKRFLESKRPQLSSSQVSAAAQ